jgi:hypothetical protein
MSNETTDEDRFSDKNSNGGASAYSSVEDKDFDAIVAARVAEELAKEKAAFKAKQDALDSRLKEETRKRVELEEKLRKEQLETLEKEGKHKEVLELKLAEVTERLRIAEERNLEYTRNAQVSALIADFDFRTPRAKEIATRMIIDELVAGEDGVWTHRSGAPLKDFVTKFQSDEENSFLFKPKDNSGSGADTPASGSPRTKPLKKLSEMTSLEAFEAAKRGLLPNQRR